MLLCLSASLLTLPLAPPAAVAVEPTPCNPERWKDDMAAFARQDEAQPPKPGGNLFVGSSSIRFWDLPKSFPELPVTNRGFGGSSLFDSVCNFDLLVARHQPQVVVLYAGDNDIAGGMSAARVHADFQAFVKKMKEELPQARLLYIAIKPCIARWQFAPTNREANALIATDCAKDDVLEYIDVWPPMLGANGKPRSELFRNDNLHMNDAGYRIWAGLVRPYLVTTPGSDAETTQAK